MTDYKYPWQEREAARKKQAKEVKPRPMRVGAPMKKETPLGPKPLKKHAPKKRQKPIAKKSSKKKASDRIYSVLRKDFLADHPVCQAQLPECTQVATEIHHKAGRGANVNNVDTFLATCGTCHRYIETHPAEAKEKGFSVSRLDKK